MFDSHVNVLIKFARKFDSTLYLKVINDHEHQETLKTIPTGRQSISYIINDLWPKLGFLPIDPNNMDTALIAEFFLNEWVFNIKESTDLENLEVT